jgi:hypothetical protein
MRVVAADNNNFHGIFYQRIVIIIQLKSPFLIKRKNLSCSFVEILDKKKKENLYFRQLDMIANLFLIR